MNRLTSPRAGRPLKARVSAVAVYRGSASAALYRGCAPLSGQRRKAVPHCAAAAAAAISAGLVVVPERPPVGSALITLAAHRIRARRGGDRGLTGTGHGFRDQAAAV